MLRLSHLRLAVCAAIVAASVSGCAADPPPPREVSPTTSTVATTPPKPRPQFNIPPHPTQQEVYAELDELSKMVKSGTNDAAIRREYDNNMSDWCAMWREYNPDHPDSWSGPYSFWRPIEIYKENARRWYHNALVDAGNSSIFIQVALGSFERMY